MIFNKKILFYIKIFFAISAVAVVILAVFSGGEKKVKQLPVTSSLFPSFIKTEIGKTTDKEVEALEVIDKKTLPDGTISYHIKSVNPLKADRIITKNGVVVFEETSTFTDKPGGFPKINSFLTAYGKPDEQIKGYLFYGPLEVIYVYASRGFVFIGNPPTNQIDEIHRFLPTTSTEYKRLYGQDIRVGPPAREGPQ